VTPVVACAVLRGVAAPVCGTPAVHDAWRVAVALPLGAVAFVSLGVLLGSLLPSARSAQAVGLLLFFPSFLLGAGGPPPHVMGAGLRDVADVLPLTQVTKSIREPWLGLGTATSSLVIAAVLAVVATAVAVRRAALEDVTCATWRATRVPPSCCPARVAGPDSACWRCSPSSRLCSACPRACRSRWPGRR